MRTTATPAARARAQPPKNVDLVKEALELSRRRPAVRFEWIKAHDGCTWNEGADRLAGHWTALRRDKGTA